jgi:cytochrome c
MEMKLVLIAGWCGLMAAPSMAQISYGDCGALAASDFTATELFDKTGDVSKNTNSSLTEPVQMDFEAVKTGDSITSVNIYFVERLGAVKMYNGATKAITLLKTIPTWANTERTQNDNGLMGIALDPDFATNKWIYLWYTPPMPQGKAANRRMHLSRWTFANNTLGEEKTLLDILGSKTDQWHCGGPMTFDSYGDLWVTVGNNSKDVNGSGSQISTTDSSSSAEWGSSNTHSLRGGVFRIHPDNSAKGYSIPKGNFGEYFADQFTTQGKSASLIAQYKDTTKVSPEVYIKGTRSNYSIAVHPTKRWLAWGEVNYNSGDDEFNLVTHPAFTGFPYYHSNNKAVPGSSASQSATAPMNNSPFNSGVKELPAVTPPVLWYGNSITATTVKLNVAIGGPIYVYDRNLKSSTKFPPHFHNNWLIFSEGSSEMDFVPLDSTSVTVKGTPTKVNGGIFPTFRNPINAKYGPEGSLYVMNYSGSNYSTDNPGIVKIDYKGTCKLSAVGTSTRDNNRKFNIAVSANGLTVRESGDHVFNLYDISGNLVVSMSGTTGADYNFDKLRSQYHLKSGVHVVRIKTNEGLFTRNVSFL